MTKNKKAKGRCATGKGDFFSPVRADGTSPTLATLDVEPAKVANLLAGIERSAVHASEIKALATELRARAEAAEAKVERLREALAALMACLGDSAGLALHYLSVHDFDSVADFERCREQLRAEVDAQRVLAETGGEP